MSRNEKIKRIDIALAIAVVVLMIFCLILVIDRKHDRNVLKDAKLKEAILTGGAEIEKASNEKYFYKKYKVDSVLSLAKREKVLQDIASGKYDSVVISSGENKWKEEWFTTYVGSKTCIVDEAVVLPENLRMYLDACANSNGKISEIYLNIDPSLLEEKYYAYHKYGDTDLTFIQKMQECLWDYMGECKGILFHVLLPVYSIDKWNSFSIKHIADVENDWDQFIKYSCRYSNMEMICLADKEWIIANEDYFSADGTLNENLQFFEFIKSFGTDYLTDYNSYAKLMEDIGRYRRNDENSGFFRPDLSGWDIVFMGDGTITDSGWGVDSVSDMVKALSGARVYDFALNGSTIGSKNEKSFYNIVGKLVNKDSSVPDVISDDFERFMSDSHDFEKTVFVVMYGSGDYLSAVGLGSDSSSDKSSFVGALTEGVSLLKEAFSKKAKIMLVTPGYISVYDGGLVPVAEEGATLPEYVDSMKAVASSQNVWFFDNYSKGFVNESNADMYLYQSIFPEIEAKYQTSKLLVSMINEYMGN